MVGTIAVRGSGGRVLAPIGGGEFLQGTWRDIQVTGVSGDEDLPLEVRQELVGLEVPTIFGPEDINDAIPVGSRAAYHLDVAEVLRKAGKAAVAEKLVAAVERNDPTSEYNWLVFKAQEYKFVS